MSTELTKQMTELAQDARRASTVLRSLSTSHKNRALRAIAEHLVANAIDILNANAKDMNRGKHAGLSEAMLDRLLLDEKRIEKLAQAVRDIEALADPVGEIAELRSLPNGLSIGRMRVPLGVIAIIYESRPNVTIDAAALCLKSGNACILRGGSEAFETNQALGRVIEQALLQVGLPKGAVVLVPTQEREATHALLKLSKLIDLVIPRGGESLIEYVTEQARMPVIQHFKGVCHVYVDADADFDMAESIVINSKAQRTGVCNALETLLIDSACADAFVPRVVSGLVRAEIEVRGDARVCALSPKAKTATDADWDTEYLDRIIAVAVVNGIEGALKHIEKHGTHHTEAIVTNHYANAQRFLKEVDASLVLINASTRFNDGGELGLGAEMGISTTKLHAYGPMGLRELCTQKWVGLGSGQIRL